MKKQRNNFILNRELMDVILLDYNLQEENDVLERNNMPEKYSPFPIVKCTYNGTLLDFEGIKKIIKAICKKDNNRKAQKLQESGGFMG